VTPRPAIEFEDGLTVAQEARPGWPSIGIFQQGTAPILRDKNRGLPSGDVKIAIENSHLYI